jgi:DNA-binding NtrC family response regulator
MAAEKIRVLIVDDEKSVRKLISRVLGSNGYECSTAADGTEALQRLAMKSFDVVLLDIRMPDISGMEALPRISAGYPDVCVIMLTAVVDMNTAVEALDRGACDYVTKPFDTEDLVMRVERALNVKRLVRERASSNSSN